MSQDLWIFAYGSLMWNPGFDAVEQHLAHVDGFARGFFMHSVHYRGTESAPGLVLALDVEPGGSCQGVALRVHSDQAATVLDYLRARELVSYAYYEHECPARLQDGRVVLATTFVVAHDHAQYAGRLPLDAQAEIIARAAGSAGSNRDYLCSTVARLRELGISAPELFDLEQRVSVLSGQ